MVTLLMDNGSTADVVQLDYAKVFIGFFTVLSRQSEFRLLSSLLVSRKVSSLDKKVSLTALNLW